MEKSDFRQTVIDGVETRYIEKGKGEPLVLIHGGLVGQTSSSMIWDLNFDRFAESYHVVAFDKLAMGFTGNPPSRGPFTSAATTEHAFKFLKSLGIESAHVAAHSRGGLTAIRLALEHPGFAKSLTLIDSGSVAPDNPPRVGDFYKEMEESVKGLSDREAIVARSVANSFSKKHITDALIDDLLEVYQLPKSIEARERTNGLSTLDAMPDTREQRTDTLKRIDAGQLQIPTLLFWGMNDPSALVDRGINLYKQMTGKVPDVQMHIVNQAGHYSFREQYREFDETMLGFLATLE